MVFIDAPGQTHDGTPGILIPVGRAKPGEGGHHIAAVGVADLLGHVLGVRGGINEPQFIAEPLQGRSCHKNGAFQRILHFPVQSPRDGGDKAVFAEHRSLARVHQQKAPGAVGVFRLAGGKAGLPEQCRLLISRCPRNGDRRAEELGQSLPVDTAAGPDLRQHTPRNVQLPQNIFVPLEGTDVEQHGSGGVGVVRHMDSAPGELPDEPGLHRSKQQFPFFRPLPGAGHIFQNPAQLGAGKIGVDDKAGLFPKAFRQPLCLQLVTVFTGAAALPDDGPADGLTGFPVPDNGCLPLVGDADGGDIGSGSADVFHGLPGHLQLSRPDFIRVVLHPPRLGEILGELLLGHGADLARFIE